MRWDPARGHVPRGFFGAAAALGDIELVLVVAEPGDPSEREISYDLASTYKLVSQGFPSRFDQFHRNMLGIFNSCWPNLPYDKQLEKVWVTESVLCSAAYTTGPVDSAVTKECGIRYLSKQLTLMPSALVVALGSKAQHRLRLIGVHDFLPAFAIAPPGCNFAGAKKSWGRISIELKRRRSVVVDQN